MSRFYVKNSKVIEDLAFIHDTDHNYKFVGSIVFDGEVWKLSTRFGQCLYKHADHDNVVEALHSGSFNADFR